MVDHAPQYRSYESDPQTYDDTPAERSVSSYPVGLSYQERSVPLFLSDRDGIPHPSEYTPSMARKHGSYYLSGIMVGALGGVVIAIVAALFSSSETGRQFLANAKVSSVAALSAASVAMQPGSSPASAPEVQLKDSVPSSVANVPANLDPGLANSASANTVPSTVAVAALTPTHDDIKTAYQGAMPGSAPQAAAPVAGQPAASQDAVRSLDAGEVAALLKRAEVLMTGRDYIAARLVLERAAEAGDAHAAMLLAGTYDPAALERQGIHGVVPDPAMAKSWYEKARRFGATEATAQLDVLSRK